MEYFDLYILIPIVLFMIALHFKKFIPGCLAIALLMFSLTDQRGIELWYWGDIWLIPQMIILVIALRITNILSWLAVWAVSFYVALSYGIDPPVPSSLIGMFMGIFILALLAYLSTRTEDLNFAKETLVKFLIDEQHKMVLGIVVLALPFMVAYKVFTDVSRQPQPPVASRTIHPSPPNSITFKGKKIDLKTAVNPYRELEAKDPQAFKEHVKNGRRVYYQNCAFCHGDNMEGDGVYAHAFDPIPANFQDPTTIAMLQESFLFWRIAKGAPGLPDESTPWSSAMPAWEKFLSEDEIWDVILFLYDFTGQAPRAREEHGGGH